MKLEIGQAVGYFFHVNGERFDRRGTVVYQTSVTVAVRVRFGRRHRVVRVPHELIVSVAA